MIAYGMLYATAVALPILLAAIVVSSVLRRQGRAERGVWLSAMALAVALPVVLLTSPAAEAPTASAPVIETGLIGLPAVVAVPTVPAVAVPAVRSAFGFDDVLLSLWLLASLVLVIRWGVAALRLARLTDAFPPTTMDGVQVRLTPNLGPAVSGVVRPRILVPSWLASMPPRQRSLVLLHEEEHVRARDPVLVVVSRIARVLAPWNPFVWLLSSRLLRAVELDCDRRVLRRHPDVEAYGHTLLTVSSRDPGALLGAAAFAESEAPLRKRILAMTTPPRTVSVLGVLTALVLGVLLLVGVFEVPVPALRMQVDVEPPTSSVAGVERDEEATLAERDAMAERVAELLAEVSALETSRAEEDEVRERLASLETEIRALEASQREAARRAEEAEARVRELTELVGRERTGRPGSETASRPAALTGTITGVIRDGVSDQSLRGVQVFLRGTGIGGLSNDNGRFLLLHVPAGEHEMVAQLMGYGEVSQTVTVVEGETVSADFLLRETAVPVDGVVVTGAPAESDAGSESDVPPLIYIDGVRIQEPRGSLDSYLDGREDIERIEVIKPPAATALYGEEAAGGVVQIFLKGRASEPAQPTTLRADDRPTFTPFTVAPRVRNVEEVRRAMLEAYPPELREQGIGGTVDVYFFIDEEGIVRDFRIDKSSGHAALDDAALAVAGVYRFSPALNRDERVPVWVALPITFLQRR